MIREAVNQTDWREMTMTMLQEKQFEACEKRMKLLPSKHLFSEDVTDTDAQTLYEHSYLKAEIPNHLASIQWLRQDVLRRLPMEVGCISLQERTFLERLVLFDGEVSLSENDDIGAAESLARRLWCSLSLQDDIWYLKVPKTFLAKLLCFLADVPEERCSQMFRLDATVHAMLYLAGFLQYDQPNEILLSEILKDRSELAQATAGRFFQASYDYLTDSHGKLILLHPGLADPYALNEANCSVNVVTLQLNPEVIAGAMNEILDDEIPLHEAMRGELNGAVRPELNPDEAAEDLRLLIKQNVPLTELKDVLGSMLAVLPTQRMEEALKQLYLHTPHWFTMNTALEN